LPFFRLCGVIGAAIAVSLFAAVPGRAQSFTGISNGYISVVAGISGDVRDAGPNRDTSVPVSGRWSVGTVGGDPEKVGDEYSALVAGHPLAWGAYTIIRIDDREDSVVYGDTENGRWVVSPVREGESLSIYSEFEVEEVPIRVKRRIRILRDVVMVRYEIENRDTRAHRVGLATYVDSEYGVDGTGFLKRGGPYYAPMLGRITRETIAENRQVPEVVYGFDRLPNYGYVTQFILDGQGATKPDRVVFGHSPSAWGDFWAYNPTRGGEIRDACLMMFWNQRLVPAARQRDPITFYFGLGQASHNLSAPAVVALHGPFALEYNRRSGEDTGRIEPDPFTLYAFVYNQSTDVPLRDVQVQLELPFGIGFDDGEAQFKTIGEIAPGAEGWVSWSLYADGTEFGELPVTLTVSGFPMGVRSVTRFINVPATETIFLYANEKRMLSAPFTDGGGGALGNLFSGAYRWSPLDGVYRLVPGASPLGPGDGFWYRVFADQEFSLSGVTPVPGSTTEPFLLSLQRGWNQIGNPYLYGIPLARCRVVRDAVEGSLSLDEAVNRNLIRGVVYRWDPTLGTAGEYVYDPASQAVLRPWEGYWIRALQPVTLVIPPVEAIGARVTYTASSGGSGGGGVGPPAPGSVQTTRARPRRPLAGFVPEWSARLSAFGRYDSDTRNIFGQSAAASDGYDRLDVDKAPPGGSLSCAFVEAGLGENSGYYAASIRSLRPGQEWKVQVASHQVDQPVTLRWSGLETLPAGMRLRLVDTATGRSMVLRPGSTYRFDAKAGQPRLFRIVSEGARGGRAR